MAKDYVIHTKRRLHIETDDLMDWISANALPDEHVAVVDPDSGEVVESWAGADYGDE